MLNNYSQKSSAYNDIRDWLESFIPLVYGREELKLSRIENLLRLLKNPQKKFKSILVGGTAGKGSTAYYIARLLQFSKFEILNPCLAGRQAKSEINKKFKKLKNKNKEDFSNLDISASNFPTKVGLHVSPHLVYIGERMQIFQCQNSKLKTQKFQGSAIPVKRLIGLVNEIKPVIDDIKSKQPELAPSYFEILVAMSFLYFAKEKVDWAVVEVGLGGRLDATNVLMPEISVITNVGLDHTELLGETIEKIAKEKAGIIKTKMPVVTGSSGKALKVIEKVARLASAPLIILKSESKWAKSKNALLINLNTLSKNNRPDTDIERYIARYYYSFRTIGSSFASQNKNLALVTVLSLGIKLDSQEVKRAFFVGFAGRFEQIDDGVVLDGAHNLDKIKALIYFVQKGKGKSEKGKVVLVLAFKKGKNWKEMIDLLMKNLPIKKIIATKYQAVTDTGKGSAVEPEEIARYVRQQETLRDSGQARDKRQVTVKTVENSQEAVFEAMGEGYSSSEPFEKSQGKLLESRSSSKKKFSIKSNNNLVLVTGSLYLVGEARTLWKLPEF